MHDEKAHFVARIIDVSIQIYEALEGDFKASVGTGAVIIVEVGWRESALHRRDGPTVTSLCEGVDISGGINLWRDIIHGDVCTLKVPVLAIVYR